MTTNDESVAENLDSITLPELSCETCGEPAIIKTVWNELVCLDCYSNRI